VAKRIPRYLARDAAYNRRSQQKHCIMFKSTDSLLVHNVAKTTGKRWVLVCVVAGVIKFRALSTWNELWHSDHQEQLALLPESRAGLQVTDSR
jgi:hypothetical protein